MLCCLVPGAVQSCRAIRHWLGWDTADWFYALSAETNKRALIKAVMGDEHRVQDGPVPAFPSAVSFIAALKLRMLSPRPLPDSGSFFGPKTRRALPTMRGKCIG